MHRQSSAASKARAASTCYAGRDSGPGRRSRPSAAAQLDPACKRVEAWDPWCLRQWPRLGPAGFVRLAEPPWVSNAYRKSAVCLNNDDPELTCRRHSGNSSGGGGFPRRRLRMGGRAVECTGLEIRRGRKSSVGSNPTPSAKTTTSAPRVELPPSRGPTACKNRRPAPFQDRKS